jgi:phage N-6-adenine-methyltransferase
MTRMTELTERRDRPIEQFDPSRHRLKVAALDYTIKEARQIRRWDALYEAVDAKIAEQVKFVAWWTANVRRAGGDQKSEARKSLLPVGNNDRLTAEQAEDETGMSPPQVSRLGTALEDQEGYRDQLLGPEFYAAYIGDEEKAKRIREAIGSGQIEWYTPPKYIGLVREVFGEIDLDPASSDIAQRTVQATTYFTKEDDGLTKDWHGRVWLNPPYADGVIGQFITKLIDEYRSGRISQAIVLVNNNTDAQWFHDGVNVCSALCFPLGRIKFIKPNGDEAPNTAQGQACLYFGDNVAKFKAVFKAIGSFPP